MSQPVERKYIVIEDIGRELTPIGYGLRSPLMKPSPFPIDTVGRLLSVSGVTKMFEVFEKDYSLRVPLTKANFRKPFRELWEEQNPDKVFPWNREVVEVVANPDTAPVETGTATFTGTPVAPDESGTISGTVLVNSLPITPDGQTIDPETGLIIGADLANSNAPEGVIAAVGESTETSTEELDGDTPDGVIAAVGETVESDADDQDPQTGDDEEIDEDADEEDQTGEDDKEQVSTGEDLAAKQLANIRNKKQKNRNR